MCGCMKGLFFSFIFFQSAVCLSTLVTWDDVNVCVCVGKHAQTPECEAVW